MTDNIFSREIFNDNFFKLLKTVSLTASKRFHSSGASDNPAKLKGGAVEFADYRKYSYGDDFKHIDWNVFLRTGKLFVKEYSKEENLNIAIILDNTLSMDFGTPNTKFLTALYSSAILSYITLLKGGNITFATYSNNKPLVLSFNNLNNFPTILSALSKIKTDKATELTSLVNSIIQSTKDKGFLVLLSDLFDNSNLGKTLSFSSAKGYEVHIMHILSKLDISPQLQGNLVLIDSETQNQKEFFVDKNTLLEYSKKLNDFCQNWQNFCLKHRIDYYFAPATINLENFLINYLSQSRIFGK